MSETSCPDGNNNSVSVQICDAESTLSKLFKDLQEDFQILEEIYGRYARELDQNKVEVEKANQELQEKKAKKCDQLRALFKND